MCTSLFGSNQFQERIKYLNFASDSEMRTSYLLVLLSHATLLQACLHHRHCFFGTCFWSGWTLGIFLQHLQTFGLTLSWFLHLLWQLFKLPGISAQFVFDLPKQALPAHHAICSVEISGWFILPLWLGHLLCQSIMPASWLQSIGYNLLTAILLIGLPNMILSSMIWDWGWALGQVILI